MSTFEHLKEAMISGYPDQWNVFHASGGLICEFGEIGWVSQCSVISSGPACCICDGSDGEGRWGGVWSVINLMNISTSTSLYVVIQSMNTDVLWQQVTSGNIVGAVGAPEWQPLGFVELLVMHQLSATASFKWTRATDELPWPTKLILKKIPLLIPTVTHSVPRINFFKYDKTDKKWSPLLFLPISPWCLTFPISYNCCSLYNLYNFCICTW